MPRGMRTRVRLGYQSAAVETASRTTKALRCVCYEFVTTRSKLHAASANPGSCECKYVAIVIADDAWPRHAAITAIGTSRVAWIRHDPRRLGCWQTCAVHCMTRQTTAATEFAT
jgi:hypothetical protein